ncbi:1-phosphofructokinase family hexose kinase [Cumulibacter manganitolerans]|uniref:1-phosphofructokinase family hexose kinase n=1 Tax=Cumulibacter manganitolerans TaxID=1884992 RepID=UPI001297718E|nr:1-phosphofructokinase family hexose kinase [Cumulibacter manganitolerans]
MIVTLTANPSVDRTMTFAEPLVPGEVHRAVRVVDQAGGKGVNVARVLALAGHEACAVLPADVADPVIEGLHDAGVHVVNVPTGVRCRVNVTVVEPGGRTTKLNAPGHPPTAEQRAALARALRESSVAGGWVVLAGSLPAGVPPRWYAALVADLKGAGRRVAVDTSGAPLTALLEGAVLPDLIKPNSEELASLTGTSAAVLESDLDEALAAARGLLARGVGAVLLTLGGAGAALVTPDGAWTATPPPITVASTVGAGDSALAGYLLADAAGAEPAERLRYAVAYGSAAAALPGTTMPTPDDLDLYGARSAAYPSPTMPPAHRTDPRSNNG